jgi:hypothetical protein
MTDTYLVRKALRRLRDLPDDACTRLVRQLLLDEQVRQAPVIVFRSPRAGVFVVGRHGYERELRCDLIGMSLAWFAMRDGEADLRPHVLVADFDPRVPGALEAAARAWRDRQRAMRRSIRVQCADWAEHEALCPELAAAFQCIRIEDTRAVYRSAPGAPRFVVGL